MAIFHGKIHYKWPFSIAMLVYQRVNVRPNPPIDFACSSFSSSAFRVCTCRSCTSGAVFEDPNGAFHHGGPGDPNGWVSWKIHWKSQSKLDDLGIFPFTLDGLSPGFRKIPRFLETAIFLAVLSFGKKPAKRSTENLRKLSPQFMALW